MPGLITETIAVSDLHVGDAVLTNGLPDEVTAIESVPGSPLAARIIRTTRHPAGLGHSSEDSLILRIVDGS